MSPFARRSVALLPAVLAALAHFPALNNLYVLDDKALLSENPFLRSWAGLLQLVTHELFAASGEVRVVPYYRPLAGISYWLSYQFLGTNSVAQHALNVLLHVFLVLLVQRLLVKLGAGSWTAAASSALLAVHPATADIVAYVGGRQDLLGWLCLMAGGLTLLRARALWAVALLLFFVTGAAALCREFFFATPLLLLPIALHGATRASAIRRAGAELAGGFAAVACVLLLRRALDLLAFETTSESALHWLGAHGGVAARLFHDLLWPSDLAVDVTIAPDQYVGGAAFALAPLLAAAYLLRCNARGCQLQNFKVSSTLFGSSLATCFCVTLLHTPVALKFGLISDRYAYGMVLGGVWLLSALLTLRQAPPKLETLRTAAAPALLLLTALALVPLSWARGTAYHDEASLQEAMFLERPDDPQSQLAEGMRLLSDGHISAATPHCRAYATALPSSDRANFCLAFGFFVDRDFAQATHLLMPYSLARPGAVAACGLLIRALLATPDLEALERLLNELDTSAPQAADLRDARQVLQSRKSRAH